MKNKNIFIKAKYLTLLFVILLTIAQPKLSMAQFDDAENFESIKSMDIYRTLLRELDIYYVDKIQSGDLIKSSIDAMLKTLDPYTTYIPESRIEDYKFMTTGQYGGIGAVIQNAKDNVVVIEPYKDAPADKAGLKAGDIILEIDGKSIIGKSTNDISKFLKGQPNTEVNLKINRKGTETPFNVVITRQKITINSVPYYGMLNEQTGYIILSSFTRSAGTEVQGALVDLKENHNAKSIILDLRENPGGLLNEAVNIVNLFVNRGQEVVSMRGKVKQWNKVFKAQNKAIDTEIPLVVLINSGSASASEIVSGAIQDLDRGVIVGRRSFGKGLVQATRPLSYNSQLKVTTAKYYIPSGRCIQALDYSHRNLDGSVGKVPDSLISKFKTLNGREVFDGGGIEPDIITDLQKYSKLTFSLIQKVTIFNFVTEYCIGKDSVPPPKEFVLSDEEYNSFIDFVEKQGFDYESNSSEVLNKLIAVMREENIYKKTEAEINALQAKLAHNLKDDLIYFRDEIESLIREEIICRYYYQEGRIKAALLRNDNEISKALEILSEVELTKYKSILTKQ